MKSLSEVTTSDLLTYLAGQRQRGWSDSSLKLAVNALRSLFSYVAGTSSPAGDVPVPRPRPKLQRTLSAQQALAVIASCDTSTLRGARDLALLCLMFDTGLRSIEVCRLQLQHLNLAERWLQARVKGGKIRSKVFTTYTALQVSRWLSVRGEAARSDVMTVFVSIGGTMPGSPLTPNGMRCIFRVIGRATGLDKFSPHDTRRTFATLTIRFGASSRMVQEQGGWENLEELERYTQALQLQDVEPYLPIGRLEVRVLCGS